MLKREGNYISEWVERWSCLTLDSSPDNSLCDDKADTTIGFARLPMRLVEYLWVEYRKSYRLGMECLRICTDQSSSNHKDIFLYLRWIQSLLAKPRSHRMSYAQSYFRQYKVSPQMRQSHPVFWTSVIFVMVWELPNCAQILGKSFHARGWWRRKSGPESETLVRLRLDVGCNWVQRYQYNDYLRDVSNVFSSMVLAKSQTEIC